MKTILVIATLSLLLTSCGDTPEATSSEVKQEVPVEQKLAVLDNIYDTTDIKAVRIKYLLKELSDKYSEPKDSIAEYTFRANSVLHDKGIDQPCLSIMEEMHKMNKMDNTSYKDAITYYLLVHSNQ